MKIKENFFQFYLNPVWFQRYLINFAGIIQNRTS